MAVVDAAYIHRDLPEAMSQRSKPGIDGSVCIVVIALCDIQAPLPVVLHDDSRVVDLVAALTRVIEAVEQDIAGLR